MLNKKGKILISLIILVVIMGCFSAWSFCRSTWCGFVDIKKSNQPVNKEISVGNEHIKIFNLVPNAIISSPVVIKGEAKGWYFEGSFPVKLLDANGNQLASSPSQAKGDWMTSDFVQFDLSFSFKLPETTTGTLVFEKDNLSGLPENDQYFTLPVVFYEHDN